MTFLSLNASSSLVPCSVYTWSRNERARLFVIIMWLEDREISYISLRMCRNVLKCVLKSLCGFLRFGQLSTSNFLWLSKSTTFLIVQTVLKIPFFNEKKSRWTCGFEKCLKLHENSLYYGENGLAKLIVFFGTPLISCFVLRHNQSPN